MKYAFFFSLLFFFTFNIVSAIIPNTLQLQTDEYSHDSDYHLSCIKEKIIEDLSTKLSSGDPDSTAADVLSAAICLLNIGCFPDQETSES